MRLRKKSFGERALETVPVLLIVGMGIAGVFVAMNVLVSAVPVAVDQSTPTPFPTPTFEVTPSASLAAPTRPVYTPAPTASLPSSAPTIVHSAVSDKDAAGVWVVYLSYPAFVEGTTPWAAAMNSEILSDMQAQAARFENGPASIRQATGKANILTGTFKTDLLTPSLASFTLTFVDDTTPGYPSTTVETLNYDLATGQQIGFDDLFLDSQTALTLISLQVPTLLQAELGAAYDPVTVASGTAASSANYQGWALTSSGLRVTFAQAQVADIGAGLQSVIVPWTALRPVMVSTGPVALLAGVY
jgi:hypothetical protein